MFRKADRETIELTRKHLLDLDLAARVRGREFIGMYKEMLGRQLSIEQAQGKLYSAIDDLCKLVNTSNEVLADRLDALHKGGMEGGRAIGAKLDALERRIGGCVEDVLRIDARMKKALNRKKRGKK